MNDILTPEEQETWDILRYTIITDEEGSKHWYLNGKHHREDGPAIEYADGSREWYIDGKLHREDGPAIEYVGGHKQWWVNGKILTKEEFNERMKK